MYIDVWVYVCVCACAYVMLQWDMGMIWVHSGAVIGIMFIVLGKKLRGVS